MEFQPESLSAYRDPQQICAMEEFPTQLVASKNDESGAPETFYAGALDRIRRFMIALSIVSVAAVAWRWDLRHALGFALGCAIAYLNFHWLKRGVSGLVNRNRVPASWFDSCCAMFC